MSRFLKILVFMIFLSVPLAICISPGLTFEDERRRQSDTATQKEGQAFSLGVWLASIYKDYISPVDGSRCPSWPSCSSYSASAFKKHGFFMGWLMTVDRLIHEGKEESSVSPLVYTEKGLKILDPVENNDFWWFRGDREEHD